jgi:tRNA U34 2-thiouridine synthase MnmA/TrmU
MVEKCLVLYSGGLDSRLAIKLMQEKGYEVIALNFVLPFGCSCCDESFPISVGQN